MLSVIVVVYAVIAITIVVEYGDIYILSDLINRTICDKEKKMTTTTTTTKNTCKQSKRVIFI